MDGITLGYAEINYVHESVQGFRVSTVIKDGNWRDRFVNEIEGFVYLVELTNPLSLDVFIYCGYFINNKSDNVINQYVRVV